MNLREKKKEERRNAILNAATELFGELGFSKTNMEQIAEVAGVGVATVYKHFGTKAGIMDALIRPETERLLAEGEEVIANPPDDPAEAIIELIRHYTSLKNNWSEKKLLRALSILGSDTVSEQETLVVEADNRVKQQIRDLLLVLKTRKKISANVSLTDATAIIFSIFNQEYNDYVIGRISPKENVMDNLTRRYRLLFDGLK